MSEQRMCRVGIIITFGTPEYNAHFFPILKHSVKSRNMGNINLSAHLMTLSALNNSFLHL